VRKLENKHLLKDVKAQIAKDEKKKVDQKKAATSEAPQEKKQEKKEDKKEKSVTFPASIRINDCGFIRSEKRSSKR
jgi:hypothetical protein